MRDPSPASKFGGDKPVGHHECHGHSHNHGCHDHGCHDHGCHDHGHDHGAMTGVELTFAIIAATTLTVAWLGSLFSSEASSGLSFNVSALYWVAFLSGGLFAAVDAIKSLVSFRLTIDTLMVAAGIGAAFIGHLPEGALLLTLFSIGHAAEHHAMSRAEKSIHALTAMRPTTASRIDPTTGDAVEVPIEEIVVGDTVLVRPDSRVPVDGVVVFGQSSVDQSPITGESIPIDKVFYPKFDIANLDFNTIPKEHVVFAGSINGSGSLEVQVARKSDESTLARVGRLIAEAKTQRSPTQRLTESFERRFVPAVLALVGLLLFAFLILDEPFSASLYRAMAVLVAASPCALAIATPSAVLSAIARAGREGVLIKGGGPLEQLGKVKAIAFDKTGTLTTGRPEVAELMTMPDVSRQDLLSVAVAVQRQSDHPLSRAIVRAGNTELGPIDDKNSVREVSDTDRISGQGVVAKLNGKDVAIGNLKLFENLPLRFDSIPMEIIESVNRFREKGYTIAIVGFDHRFLGVIGIVDTPRPAAMQAIASLRKVGMGPLVMLSGDHGQAVRAIADQLNLDEAKGDLLPEEKVAEVSAMSKRQVTAMVGDGANDAPAMAAASVSIAMGAAGSDVALETADIALMGDDLAKLPFAIGLGQAASRIIHQNLWISLGMIAFLVPAAILGLALGPAVVMHEGSTIVVVANALRLLGYNPAGKALPQ